MLALKVNETKAISRKTFIDTFFTLESEKNQRMTKGLSLETARGCLICPLTLRHRLPHVCGLVEYFKFSHFQATCNIF